MKEIIRALEECREERKPCVIAVIIDVNGSAYRREGARCVIHQDGTIIGILSGGCLEDDVKAQAADVFETGRPRRLYYDFRWGEDDVWGLGIGCNGAISVWLELFDPAAHPREALGVYSDLSERAVCQAPYYLVTVVESGNPEKFPQGSHWKVQENSVNDSESVIAAAGAAEALPEKAGLLEPGRTGAAGFTLFIEKVTPRPRLAIIGTSADAVLLCRMAKSYGWHVSIVYHETAKASAAYFPEADEIVHVPRGQFSDFPIAPGQAVAVMTHNLDLDREAVRQLLPRPISYFGVLGSRQRIGRILDSLRSEGHPELASGELPAKLHAPIGLDIGGSTPEEITLSIMAELIAAKNGRRIRRAEG